MTQEPAQQTVTQAVMNDPPTDGATFLREITRRGWRTALAILPIVALINLSVLVYSVGGLPLAESFVRPQMLALACLIVFIPMTVASIRIWLWGRFLGLPFSFGNAFRVITGTMVANAVTPSAAGGLPIKMMFLVGEGVPANRAVTIISFQWVEDTLVLLSLGAIALIVTGLEMADFLGPDFNLMAKMGSTLRSTGWVLAIGLGAAVIAIVTIRAGLWGHKMRELGRKIVTRLRGYMARVGHDWSEMMRRGKVCAFANIGLALIQWSARFSIAGLVLSSFGTQERTALFWLLQYMVQNISSIIPTPGGAGGAEAAFLVLFAPFVPSEILVPAMSTWRLIFFYLPLGGAALIFFLLGRKYRKREKQRRVAADVAARQPAE